ncbi:testis-expressed protein 264-like [Neocloeon triangulifer]|uniref:testis-expressed protein 264-like n=1 Tax=Neocloeon triangulifer TaxID=2078957 RepID=UPI00286EE451|nr:testis-expressed protein 264-like [Neocloeon triangulifer]
MDILQKFILNSKAANYVVNFFENLKILPIREEKINFLTEVSPAVALCAGFVFAFIIFLLYSGMCHRVKVKTDYSLRPMMTIAYLFDFGGYREAAKAMDEWRLLYPSLPRITILYNSPVYAMYPELPPEEIKLKNKFASYAIGFVISEGSNKVCERKYCKLKELGFNFTVLPEDSYAVTTKFVHRNYLSLFFASQKIFMPLMRFVQDKYLCAHPLIQIDQRGMLDFFAPLGKQYDFYVQEASTYYGVSLVHKVSRIQLVKEEN